jgi:Peptidase family C25
MWRTVHGSVWRLTGWMMRVQLSILILAGLLLAVDRPVAAVEVTVDATVNGTAATHNGSTPTVVFISDQTGYVFYRDSSSTCVYRKTTDGAGSWGTAVTVDAQTDCFRVAVWYDRWTPGDTTGTDIHIATMDSNDLWYTRLDTSTDALTTIVNASGGTQGGSFGAAANLHSITKGTDDALYMGVQDGSDSFVIRCASGDDCTNAVNWSEAGANPFDLAADWLILMPLAGGNIMAIRWDISAEDIQSKGYTAATNSWDVSWTMIDANAPDNSTYDAAFGATVDKTSGVIYLAYAADVSSVGGNDDIRTAIYDGTSWTAKTNVVTDSDNGKGITGVKIATHETTGTVYVVYSARAGGASTANVFWKKSTDGMATWSVEQGPVATSDGDLYGARVNSLSDERIYVTWVNNTAAGPPLLGNTIEDVSPTAVNLIAFTATHYDGGVWLQWHTGYEVDNLGFHVYREEGGQRIRVTPSLVAGSALFAGVGTALTAGRSYAWRDVPPEASGPVRYWLENVDLNGQRSWHGPVSPVWGGSVSSQYGLVPMGSAALLSRMGRQTARSPRSVGSGEWEFVTSNAGLDAKRWVEQPEVTPRQRRVQWALAAKPAIKLGIRKSGWYRVGQSELVAAGLDPGVNPRFLQLFVDGREVPIAVTGTSDEHFAAGSAIEFYGVGLDTPSTDLRTYWLVADDGPGKRVPVVAGRARQGQSPVSFPCTVEWKPRSIYVAGVKNGEAENFFGSVVATEPVEQTLHLQHLDPSPAGETWLEVALQGVTTGRHQVSIRLNGVVVGMLAFDGQVQGVTLLPIAQALLQEGENVLTFVAEGGETDVSLVDYVRLTAWRTYTADTDVLQFTVPESTVVTIGGFSSLGIRVVDITNPDAVRTVVGRVEPQGGSFAITVAVPGSGMRTVLAFAEAGVASPAAIATNQPSTWHAWEAGADLVIITHGTFRDSVEPLRALREGQGWSVVVIDVEDLYDEWSFGAKSPWALRDLLSQATEQWQLAPRFVLLVGSASLDPRNYLGLGEFDLVPTKLVDTTFLETASDGWFADLNSDGIPEMAIGRLPVRTVEEASTVVQKLVGYEQQGGARWAAVMVADEKEGFDFARASHAVEALLPDGMTVSEVFRGLVDDATTQRELLERLNDGPALVNYIGHGSVEVWRGGLLTSADARALTNGLQLPVVVSMTCLNGFFHDLHTESLAAALLNAKTGGAAAVWASSGMTSPSEQMVMNQTLVQLIFHEDKLTLGEATLGAKAAVQNQDIRRTWMLFGDPTMRVR